MDDDAEHELARIGVVSAAVIGASQALALLAGISREGVAMVGGLFRGLDNENAMRFSFLLSTPVIFAAGALKVPDLLGRPRQRHPPPGRRRQPRGRGDLSVRCGVFEPALPDKDTAAVRRLLPGVRARGRQCVSACL